MNFEGIVKRLEEKGLPVAHNEFVATSKNPIPSPPFFVWMAKETQRGGDTRNFLREISAAIELYTERRPDTELERWMETEVLRDVEFERFQTLIPDENIVQTAYQFTILQKIKEA